MLDEEKNNKLIELTNKAVSINEQLLKEEKKFIDAVADHSDVPILKQLSSDIKELNRKETLFIEAAEMLLKKSSEE